MNTTALFMTCPDPVFSALEEIEKQSRDLLEKKKTARFIDKTGDSQEVVNLIEKLRTSIVYYQVRGDYVV